MDTIEAIMTRRSVRKFLERQIPPEMVEKLLRAAMQAPSAVNQQLWHFIVITDRQQLERVTEYHSSSQMLHKAPLGILICGDQTLEKRPNTWFQDCSAATQNVLLAAHAMGLGAVWLGIMHDAGRVEGTRRVFNLPPHILPLSLVAVGYAEETPPPEDRYLPERVRYNSW
ncbi:MAG: nitroreductase family protein [Anaerolineae bacterium]|nr:nitroreductase family protein [Anaerolineae bacterium]